METISASGSTRGSPPPRKQPRLDVVASANTIPLIQRPSGLDCTSESLRTQPFYKSVEWSADGTTVIASSSANQICTYVLPSDLLEPRDNPFELRPQNVLTLPEPTRAIAPCPYFSLGYHTTQTVLVGCKDHPLQLYSLLPEEAQATEESTSPRAEDVPCRTAPPADNPRPSSHSSASSSSSISSSTSSQTSQKSPQPPHQRPLASYKFIKRETEGYISPSSLIWPLAPGTHFIAGATNTIAYFDASRNAEGPVLTIPTIPSARHIAKGSGVGMKGTVAALAVQPTSDTNGGLLAAGTWTSWVGIYDLGRAGECVATWPLAGPKRVEKGSEGGGGGDGGGGGVVQAAWSPCGRYLVLNERRSTGLAVYDVRVTGRLLARLAGRGGEHVNQRLSCDVFPSSEAEGLFEVWAGTPDGRVLVWDRAGGDEGVVEPTWDWQAHGAGSAVGATALHPGGSVLATCAGSYSVQDESESDSESDSEPNGKKLPKLRTSEDTSLKIWSIKASGD
ncbi:uncharacterized protein PgNI_04109 [Pyricularia grisea]|uniref:Anaphase-promoting complex subunit 4 WD40 domain-containing protein n=1 Tax=Pyricularia grisea TaxID=148305 RepID=A0A6P8BAG0_PYRGI|nr:uncharacterized protein PgNI_04109 [Pyricularia grisea]TLD12667.1 hypothetical protein PgNI_04109 [Pyricularia grisea]